MVKIGFLVNPVAGMGGSVASSMATTTEAGARTSPRKAGSMLS